MFRNPFSQSCITPFPPENCRCLVRLFPVFILLAVDSPRNISSKGESRLLSSFFNNRCFRLFSIIVEKPRRAIVREANISRQDAIMNGCGCSVANVRLSREIETSRIGVRQVFPPRRKWFYTLVAVRQSVNGRINTAILRQRGGEFTNRTRDILDFSIFLFFFYLKVRSINIRIMDSRKRDETCQDFFQNFLRYLLFIEQWRKVPSFLELAIRLQFNERGWFLREIKDEVYSLGSGKRPAVYGVRTRMVYYQRAFFRIVWSHLHFNLGSFPLGENRCRKEKYHAKFFSLALLSSIIRDLLGTCLYWLKNGKKGEEARNTRNPRFHEKWHFQRRTRTFLPINCRDGGSFPPN